MSSNKDLNSKPRKGFRFPIDFQTMVRIVRKFDMKMSYPEERVRVRFKNIDQEGAEEVRMLRFFPGDCVSIYSIPENLEMQFEEIHYERVLEYLSQYKTVFENSREKEVFYEANYESKIKAIVLFKVCEHFKSKFDFNNKAGNRRTSKMVKQEHQRLETIPII